MISLEAVFDWIIRSSLSTGILIGLILLCRRGLRRFCGTQSWYGLWLLLLVRMIIPWMPESPVPLSNRFPGSYSAPQDTAETNGDGIIFHPPNPSRYASAPVKLNSKKESERSLALLATTWSLIQPEFQRFINALPILWFIGGLILLVYILAQCIFLSRTLRRLYPVEDPKVLLLLDDCRRRLGIKNPLAILVAPRIHSPALFGFYQPRLVLPEGMLETFNLDELRFIFLHELAHLKRWDIVVNWLQSLAQILHWFNPLIWYGFSHMRHERELSCDALVLSLTPVNERKEYGNTIIHLLDRYSRPQGFPGIAGILESKLELKRRMNMIARYQKQPYSWIPLSAVLIIGLGFILFTDAQVSRLETPYQSTRSVLPVPQSDPPKTQPQSNSVTISQATQNQPTESEEIDPECAKLEAYILAELDRFQNMKITYNGLKYSSPKDSIYELQKKHILDILEKRKKGTLSPNEKKHWDQFSEEEIKQQLQELEKTQPQVILEKRRKGTLTDFEKQQWQLVTNEQLEQQIRDEERMKNGYYIPIELVYSRNGVKQRLDEIQLQEGKTPNWYYLDEKDGPIVHPDRKLIRTGFSLFWNKPLDYHFGANLNLFLHRGFHITKYDPQARKIQLTTTNNLYSGFHHFEFTLLEKNPAYWIQCDEIIQSLDGKQQYVDEQAICEDFREFSGMLLPQSVTIQRIRGGDEFNDKRILKFRDAQIGDVRFPERYFERPSDKDWNTADMAAARRAINQERIFPQKK